jgi:glycosyltransferase involved in cell wall biosynthesis
MLSVTVRSALEALKGVSGGGEIVIVDNSDPDLWQLLSTPNPSPLAWHYIKEEKVRLFRQDTPSLFVARMTAIREARGKYVFNVDSHNLMGLNTLPDLANFLDNSNSKVGLAYCPIGWCGQHELNARHEMRTDQDTIYAGWGKQYYEPTKICWNFGSWMTRKDWFLETHGGYGFFEKHKMAWGGGEFYVSLKTWLLGYENWAVPTDPIYHIGPFSQALHDRTNYKYRLYGNDGKEKRGIGILASFYALAGDDGKEFAKEAEAGFKKHHGLTVEADWARAKELAKEDWEWMQKHQVRTLREFWENRVWEKDT